jgi:hypothetical protein
MEQVKLRESWPVRGTGEGRGVLSTEPCLMLRPDHIWFFFTVVLSLALAMSIPRKPEQQSRADTLVPVAEHYLQ